MSSASDLRSQRAAALQEKKRRLEDLKARRNNRATSEKASSSSSSLSAVSASKTGNLDDYIDGLLNSAPPGGAATATTTDTTSGIVSATDKVAAASTTSAGETVGEDSNQKPAEATTTAPAPTPTPAATPTEPPPPPKVKEVVTFAISTQTDTNDFPEEEESKEDTEKDTTLQTDTTNETKQDTETENEETTSGETESIQAKHLSQDQVNDLMNSRQFSTFFTSASKKVERLLGAPILSELLLVDDAKYYNDQDTQQESKDDGTSQHPLLSAQVSFSFPKWTAGREISSIDFSTHHKGELMLASYLMPSTSSSSSTTTTTTHTPGSTAVKSIKPKSTPASTLIPRSKSEMTNADGLAIVWNLTMPSRPEHIFTCGSPVLQAKFHPTEPTLVIGACYSGQLVIWDVRNGRLPVQRSNLNTTLVNDVSGGSSGSKGLGHVHPVVGMEILENGSGLVTAASDGQVNFWSTANLRDPVETFIAPGKNVSSLAIAPESNSLVLGDESGVMSGVISSSSSSTSGGGGSGSANRSSSSTRRTIQSWNTNSDKMDSSCQHFGMVTGVSTKVFSTMSGSSSSSSSGVSVSKGFIRGAGGLVLSCGVDWTTKLWAPAFTDKPLLNMLSHSYDYMCDVQWSPVHPSIFATASSNGSLGLWNLATSLDEPMTGSDGIFVNSTSGGGGNTSTGSSSLNKIKWSQDGKRIAVATSDELHVLGMSEDVWKVKGDEEARMMNNFKGRGLLGDE